MALAGLSPVGTLNLRSGEPFVLSVALLDAQGEAQDLTGSAFRLAMRLSTNNVAFLSIDGILAFDGHSVTFPITAEGATTIYGFGVDRAVTYEVIEDNMATRWVGGVRVDEGSGTGGDALWMEVPYSSLIADPQALVAQEKGARGKTPQKVLYEAGLIPAPTIDSMLEILGANPAIATTAAMKASDPASQWRFLIEAGKEGAFVPLAYVDYVDKVAADPDERDYARSSFDADIVWVRQSILGQAASQIGSASGASVQTELDDNRSAAYHAKRDRLMLEEVGAREDETTSANAGFVSEWLESSAGDKKAVGTAGTFRCDPILFTTQKDIHVEGTPGSCLWGVDKVGSETLACLRIDASYNRTRVHWSGLNVNNSERNFVSAGASGSALNLFCPGTWLVEDSFFDAGLDFLTGGGDSGLVVNQGGPGSARRNRYRGQRDKGFYGTSGPSNDAVDNYADWVLEGSLYELCNTAASFTRQTMRSHLVHETAYRCLQGFGRTEASDVYPGFQIVGDGVVCKMVGTRGFRFHAYGFDKIRGWIEDFGYHPITGELLSAPTAIRVDGAQFGDIDIDVRMRDWVDTENHRAWDIRNFAFGNLASSPIGNRIRSMMDNFPLGWGVYENNGASRNRFDLTCRNVARPFYSVGVSNSRAEIVQVDGPSYVQQNNKKFKDSWAPRVTAIGDTGFDFGVSKGSFTASVTNGTTLNVTNSGGHDFLVGDTASHASALTGTTIAEQLTSTEPDGALNRRGTYRLNKTQANIASSGSWKLISSGVPSTSECRYQRSEEEVTQHGRIIIPFIYRPKGTITASVAGKVATVSNANGVLLGVNRGTVTAAASGNLWTVTNAGSVTIVAGDWPKHASILDGTTVLNQVSSSEPDGALGKAGVYTLSQAQPNIATTTFEVVNTAALMGLRNDALPIGTYITKQLTGIAGGAGTYELNQAPSANIASTSFTVLGSGDIRIYDIPWIAATGGGDGEGQTGIDGGVLFPADALDLCVNVPAGQAYDRFRWKGNAKRFLRTIDLDLPSLTLRLQWTVTYRVDEFE